jgi:hypothetical protein
LGDRKKDREDRIAALEREIAELQARLPQHSAPPAMLIELDDLEEELAALRSLASRRGAPAP